ncbi:MAG TPA: EAL domain-containing protein [Gallionellaceae bacterium]|nr:EAL domain-containing protein [Gallionellaceae bacterium]
MRISIAWRLFLNYFTVAIIPLGVLAFYYLHEFENSLHQAMLHNMATIADKKSGQIDNYISERLADARKIGQKQSIGRAILEMGQSFRNGGLNSTRHRALEKQLLTDLQTHYAEILDYYDMLLIDAAGNVLFSLAHETDRGTNLITGPYRDTQLARGFRLAQQTLQSEMTRFEPYGPSGNRGAAFLISPVLLHGFMIGSVALQMDISKLESVVTDRVGMGATGETVLAQQEDEEIHYTAPLRHLESARFNFRMPLRRAALPMQKAVAGDHADGVITDYAGIECVAAWRYLPALSWGMVVKMDTDEAMAPATRLRHATYLALLLFLLLSAITAYFLGRRLSRPITALTQTAELIAQGDLNQRAQQDRDDELGRLGNAFNHMTDALHMAHRTLEQRVKMRTAELNQANQQLQQLVADFQQAERRLLEQASLLDLAQDAIIVRDLDCHILFWNQGATATYGWASSEVAGQNIHHLLQTRFHEPQADIEYKLFRDGHWEGELEHIACDGQHITVASRWAVKRNEHGQPVAIMEINRNVSKRKRVEEALTLYASVFEHSGEAILITDASNIIVATNKAFQELTGYNQEEVLGKNPSLLASSKTDKSVYESMWNDLRIKGFWQGELWDRRKDGKVYPKWLSISAVRDQNGAVTNYIASFADISEHKAAADKISHLAHHDTLTDLPNRFTLTERLIQAFASARRNNEKVAVMFIDLDRFKLINDSLGHHIGDRLLIQVAQRLRSCVRSSDIVARLGGDEFVVGLPELEDADGVFQMADKILRALSQPYSIEGNKLHSSPSIGIAIYPTDGESVEEVMKNADMAMYHAKSKGRNNYQFFEAAMNQASMERLELENDMRSALERDEFVLHYQPKIDIRSGQVSGVEALVRWQHPRKGMISPAMFIPIAEETGLMIPLGEWVMRTACHQLHQWQKQGLVKLQMSINLSTRQFRQKNLAQVVAAIVVIENIGLAQVEFEITESMAMDNPQETIETMRMLQSLGIRLAIDDFGTGYSSLSYLKRFPMNTLKLDRSFVKDIETDPSDAAICSATIGLAHNLGLEVVAEGVETQRQYDYLKQLGCDIIQGYYFSKPLPVDEAEAYIRARNHLTPPES